MGRGAFDDIPQDVEWAIGNGSVYPLQARPVTGLGLYLTGR
jgi:hypothetical protein